MKQFLHLQKKKNIRWKIGKEKDNKLFISRLWITGKSCVIVGASYLTKLLLSLIKKNFKDILNVTNISIVDVEVKSNKYFLNVKKK